VGEICGGRKQVGESGGEFAEEEKRQWKKSTVFSKPHDLITALFHLQMKRNYHLFALSAYI
jgi:hypothetical protein